MKHAGILGNVERTMSLAMLMVGLSQAQTFPTAKQIAAEMGVGWNLGNTMELIGVQPIPTKALFDSVKAAGFKTVRIPAAWSMHADQTTHVIDAAWMAQVKKVVDYAIADGFYVILNIHWDGGWLEGKIDSAASYPAIYATIKAKQGAYWKQIATTFRDYDHHLLFASANEPGVDKQSNIGILMNVHQIFIDTVRATGGNNASRTLILPGPSTSFEHTADWITTLPTDKIADRLMVEAHFYPYQFCLMSKEETWGKPFFYWGKAFHSASDAAHNSTWGEESYVDSQFNLMKPKYLDKNIPVVVGEFGALKRLSQNLSPENLKLHILSRRHFYNTVVKSALSKGMIPVLWDAGGKGDGTMTVFDRSGKEGAIYDLGLLNSVRAAAGLSRLPGDTAADYTVATGNNSMKILYSALDSGNGQVNLGVAKVNMSGYDSILVRAHVKGTSQYDSAGTRKYGYVSLSMVTMSKGWTWREKTLGAISMDEWKTYSIPLSANVADTAALVPADITTIDFFALQAYSHGFRGAIYVDWIVFKSRNGTSDTVYTFNQSAPEESQKNAISVSLISTDKVAADQDWITGTTSKWGTTSVRPRDLRDGGLVVSSANGSIRASFRAAKAGMATATLVDPRGRILWGTSVETATGENVLAIPHAPSGVAILRVRVSGTELVGKVSAVDHSAGR
jgi:hypothetical protein